jgi:hypothetical protein
MCTLAYPAWLKMFSSGCTSPPTTHPPYIGGGCCGVGWRGSCQMGRSVVETRIVSQGRRDSDLALAPLG